MGSASLIAFETASRNAKNCAFPARLSIHVSG
jgi:hypothetical protein